MSTPTTPRRSAGSARLGGFATAALLAGLTLVSLPGRSAAQASTTDPRANLKAGVTNAGQAIENLTLVGHAPKSNGFFDSTNVGAFPFANSDLAFQGDLLFQGSFHGFQVYDISNPAKPDAPRLVRLPRRPGRPRRCTATCCSCRSSRPAAASTAAARASRTP